MRMADIVARHLAFAANFAVTCHDYTSNSVEKIESTLHVTDTRAPRKRLVTQAVVPCTFPAYFTKVCLGASYSTVTFTVEPKIFYT